MADLTLPPRNTTTASLHFTSDDHTPRLDSLFTIRGLLHGPELSDWLQLLISEHGNRDLNASIDVWHHSPEGSFDHCEVTSCHQFS